MQTHRSALTAIFLPVAAGLGAGSLGPTAPAHPELFVARPPAAVAPTATVPAASPVGEDGGDTPAGPTPEPERPSATPATLDRAADHAEPVPPPETDFGTPPAGDPHPDLGPHTCVDADAVDALAAVFDGELPLVGADYQRAFPLPDGRLLWLFQDAFVDSPHGRHLVHNVGLLQSGTCFQLLHAGSGSSPAPFLFGDLTATHERWFWPLGGDIGADGHLHVFVAEMREHSGRYLGHVEPVATWLVTIDPVTLDVVDRQPAPNPGADLYGWSVVSHHEHTYLYAHCYRQFGWDPFPGSESTAGTHDWDCTADVTVARVPRGQFDVEPEYWNGARWTNDAEDAVAVVPTDGRAVNPTQFAVLDDRFVAVTKVDDWWGTDIHLDVAPTPFGPWTTYDIVAIEARCAACNTYFASIVPFGATGQTFTIAVSNNHWNGDVIEHYRPSLLEVAIPS